MIRLLTLLALFSASAALANPLQAPNSANRLGLGGSGAPGLASARKTNGVSAITGAPTATRAAPLDLRPPSFTSIRAEEPEAVAFPTPHRTLGEAMPASFVSAPVAQAHIMSPTEEFVRRVHREGLPVARLWENKSALVSLGLNSKGKPGLWLVQKIH